MPLSVGSIVGDYEVVKNLGAGGMGDVVEAVHPIIGKKVAIKVMRSTAKDSLVEARRLLEEARAVNAIRHPGIVDIFGAGVLPDGRPYLVMELLEGLSLLEFQQKLRPVPMGDVFFVLEGVLNPLIAAHRAGVIHRDLKPSNIFVTEGGGGRRVKLLDFGVARRVDREPLTAPEITLGSLGFMSPEQMSGKPVPQSDLYSLGCIAWLLVTGQPVFPYRNVGELARHHLLTKPPLLGVLRGEVSAEFENWVMSLLEKEPAARPASAEAALEGLKEAQSALRAEPTVKPGSLRPIRSELKTVRANAVLPALGENETRERRRGPVPAASSERKTLPALMGRPPSAATLPDDDDDDQTIKIDSPRKKR